MIKYYDENVWIEIIRDITEARMGEDPAKMVDEYHKKQNYYELGSIVKVVDAGSTYDTYEKLANEFNMKYWKHYDLPTEGECYLVTHLHDNYRFEQLLYGIQSIGTEKHDYIIGQYGIQYVKKSQLLPDELFEI